MRFIPHARTWLTQGRWQDDPRHAAPPPKPKSQADIVRELMGDAFGDSPRTGFDFDGTAQEVPNV